MSLPSQLLARRMRLIVPQTLDVICERDLRVPMDDGAVLLADRWLARDDRSQPQPTVLVRSPYGRDRAVGLLFGRLLAERGLQVVVQSVRGTFGSGGTFAPFDERADGLATLRWIRSQPWHSDRIGMIGPSYLGLVQWAVAAEAGDDLVALAIEVSASQFYGQIYAGGSLALENAGSWLVLVSTQEGRFALIAINRALRQLRALMDEFPLGDLDERALGARVPWFREGLTESTRDSDYWTVRDYSTSVGEVRAPVQFVGGWYDILLPWMLEDYAALRAAGHHPQLRIGPWTHIAPGLAAASHRDGIAWLRAHLLDDDRLLRDNPVRLYVTGERSGGGWRDFPDWPPPGTEERRLWLGAGGRLGDSAPEGADVPPDHYRYDPDNPTPAVGGPVLLAREAVVDNRELEARSDVLVFTTDPLDQHVEAIGPVRIQLFARADSDYFDLFARVCDVDEHGVSRNVCDALASIAPERFERGEDGVWAVAFNLWPIAHRFATGHRIRLQVSSGAHPRYARNPGTGEDRATGTLTRAVEVELLHDSGHPSALALPAPGR
jgi:putative CocE/NonD family hydrolase